MNKVSVLVLNVFVFVALLRFTAFSQGKWQTLPNGRQRRYYHITAKGLAKLTQDRTQWRDFLNAVWLILQPGQSSA